MTKTIPIKDKNLINQIKTYYRRSGNDRDLLLFELAINTGMKVVNLLNLDVKDVKNKKSLKLKTGAEYILPDKIQNLIDKVIENKKVSEPLFTSVFGKRLGRHSAYQNFKTVCEELGFSDVSAESWRKTFGYHYYEKYKDLTFLQWYFGHQSAAQTMSYIDVQESISARFKSGINL